MMAQSRRAVAVNVMLAMVCVSAWAAPHHPPGEDEITIGHTHPTDVDANRFFTNRDVPALPLPHETDAFTFAIFGDRTGGPAEGVTVLAQAVEDVNLFEPDLVMTVGDLVEGYNEADAWMEQMREYKGIMDELLCPWFPVAGNHDIYWRGPNRPPDEHEGHYEMHFGPLWYGFEHKNCGFIVLYTDEGNPETGERNFNSPECQVMSDEQLSWLKSALERTSDLQHVFVFMHHPRWQGGNYGNDWDRAHVMLAEAGNVRAIFAGHIHHAQYDGLVDGIEYVTLATVGGRQSGVAPRAGYLHQFNLITVRPTQIAMSMIPVGEVMDIRSITDDVSDAARRLARVLPQPTSKIALPATGEVDATVEVLLSNPVMRPIEVTLIPGADDSRWSFTPDHDHAAVQPNETHAFRFRVRRSPAALDETIRLPVIRRQLDYLAPGARFEMPEISAPIPLDVQLTTPNVPSVELALDVDGSEHVEVPASDIRLPQGPMTLECNFSGRDFASRCGLITKMENSEYGFFVSDGVPAFYIHVGGSYVGLIDDSINLEPGSWHHIAGVYDGNEARLYLDGELIASEECTGDRRRNALPLIIGADVDGHGRPMSHFDGLIDAVHLSNVARYDGERFTPRRRPNADEHTLLLLNMDARTGPWVFDESPHGVHPMGAGEIVPANH